MSFKGEAIDRFAVRLTHLVIRFRWIVPVIGVLIAALVGSGASNLVKTAKRFPAIRWRQSKR